MKALIQIIVYLLFSLQAFSQQPDDLLYATAAKQMADVLPSGDMDMGYISSITSFPIRIETSFMHIQNSFPEKHYNFQQNTQWVLQDKIEGRKEYIRSAYDPDGKFCALIMAIMADGKFSIAIKYPDKAIIYYGYWEYK